MLKITTKQRRFLVIWFCVNALALFVNIANLEGDITTESATGVNGIIDERHYHLFTTRDSFNNDFWPFTTFYRQDDNIKQVIGGKAQSLIFYGVFNSYNFLAFVCYIIFGLAIVYIPKFW